uniref:Squamous cell carcinoma antigen recognized by T-cells 3 n=1 Tax=Syphacia muris TaxID=451379 RepID=A0A0N5A7Y2_9BILA
MDEDVEMSDNGNTGNIEKVEDDENNYGSAEEVDDEAMGENDIDSKITECENMLKQSPKDYDKRLELIHLLKKNGDLDELREQRKIISEQFTMPPDFWMEWINDEKEFGGDKETIKKLFTLAVTDFHSPEIYLEYAQWACGVSISFAKEVMEEAIDKIGLRCDCAFLIWNAYLDLEKMLLKSSSNEDAEKQNAKVIDIYARMLRIPHSHMQSSWNDYCTFIGVEPDKLIKADYEKALKLLPELEEFESQLSNDSITLEEKLSILCDYIEFEKKVLSTASVPNSNLWLQYGAWIDFQLKIRQVAVDTYRRAIRHSSCSALWQQYFTALERMGNFSDIQKHWNESLETVTTADEGFGLYRTHIYSLRRKAVKEAVDRNGMTIEFLNTDFFAFTYTGAKIILNYFLGSEDYTEVLRAFEEGTTFLKNNFGDYWDSPKAQFRKMHALFLYTDGKQPEKARKIWNDILLSGSGSMAASWIEAANLERYFGTIANARKLLYRGINSASDHPFMAYDALIQFEREVGTLDELDIALVKVNAQAARIASRPQKRKEKNLDRKGRRSEKANQPEEKQENEDVDLSNKVGEIPFIEKNKFGKDNERKAINDSLPVSFLRLIKRPKVVDEEGFVVPQAPVKAGAGNTTNTPQSESGINGSKEGPCAASKTVFISNLDFKLAKEKIMEIFPEAKDVRLVYRGMSKLHKGYGYVDFEDSADAIKALGKDRTLIDGRPLYVSEYKPHDRGEKSEFRYATGLEKNKIFVNNVHYDASTEQIAEVFSGFGAIKDVRIVTHKSGKSKGCAYVEFEHEDAAKAATNADEIILLDRKLSVALSNPPKKQDSTSLKPSQLLVRHRNKIDLVPRIVSKAKSISQARAEVDEKSGKNSNDPPVGQTSGQQLSNEQFRKFLQ